MITQWFHKSWKLASCAMALGLVLATGALAQSSTSALAGTATAGDVAVIRNVDTGFTREVKVKANGKYQMRNLPTGNFTVTIRHADGRQEAPVAVTLQVGRTARLQ